MSKKSIGITMCGATLMLLSFFSGCAQEKTAASLSKEACRNAVDLTRLTMNFDLSESVAMASVMTCENAHAISENDDEVKGMLESAMERQSYYMDLWAVKNYADKNEFSLARRNLERLRSSVAQKDYAYLSRYIERLEDEFKSNNQPLYISPNATSADQSDEWYVAAVKMQQCVSLYEAFGVRTPRGLAKKFSDSGSPSDVFPSSSGYEDIVFVREKGKSTQGDPGIGLVRGENECAIALKLMPQ